MPDLVKSLQGKDFGHLRIIAEMWRETLDAPDARSALPRLVSLMLNRERVVEVVQDLPTETRAALDDLLNHSARLPWPVFTRKYGALREMGAARRDREQPHRSPISPAEMLWYRGLTGRAFFDGPNGPEEFAYIPDDLAALLPAPLSGAAVALGRAASPLERAHLVSANDSLLDHVCTLLAALRLGLPAEELNEISTTWGRFAPPVGTLQMLLAAAGLLDPNGVPAPEATRRWLEMPRSEAMLFLLSGWLKTDLFNDLRMVPELKAEGEWQNDPQRARQAVFDFLSTIPGLDETEAPPFWSLGAFLDAIKQRYPDFQRPAGDYDSWYLRDQASGEYLRGFECWDQVDGALVRFLISGPMHWLGLMELALPADPAEQPDAPVTAFRFSAWAEDLLKNKPPQGLPVEDGALLVRSDFHFIVPRLTPRRLRYQLARFCRWKGEKHGDYIFEITPASLARARQQSLTVNQLLSLLNRFARVVPPNLVRALERWERAGVEARLQPMVVLRLSSPDILQALRASKAARFLGDPLGPTTISVRAGAVDKVVAALAEMGYLADVEV